MNFSKWKLIGICAEELCAEQNSFIGFCVWCRASAVIDLKWNPFRIMLIEVAESSHLAHPASAYRVNQFRHQYLMPKGPFSHESEHLPMNGSVANSVEFHFDEFSKNNLSRLTSKALVLRRKVAHHAINISMRSVSASTVWSLDTRFLTLHKCSIKIISISGNEMDA